MGVDIENFHITILRTKRKTLSIELKEEGLLVRAPKRMSNREIQDFILGGAQKCSLDGSGRIIIEDRLLKHARIDKNVVFVGAGKQIRVWAEELWEEREASRDFSKMRDVLYEYGL